MYFQGSGVEKDVVYSMMWLMLAASLGNAYALENKNLLMQSMTQKQLAQAEELTEQCRYEEFKLC